MGFPIRSDQSTAVVDEVVGPRPRPDVVANTRYVVGLHAVCELQLVRARVGTDRVLREDEVVTPMWCPAMREHSEVEGRKPR